MKRPKEFIIPFVGLKAGKHAYEFEVNKTFFEDREVSLIEDGNVHAHLILDKKETMMIGEYTVSGVVFTNCDRCNDPVELPISGSFRIVYKFGLEPSDDENLIVLHPEDYELDVSEQLYELMCVSLPTRILHKPGDCNEEVMSLYDTYIVNAHQPDEEEDEEWDDDDDWEDEDWDDEDDDTPDSPDDNKPIDPRWSVLKNLN